MKRTIILITLTLLSAGIANGQAQPKTPTIITERIGVYTPAQFDADVGEYDAAMRAKDSGRAQEVRDRVVYRTLMNYDYVYGQYKNALYSGRGKMNILLDGLEGSIV